MIIAEQVRVWNNARCARQIDKWLHQHGEKMFSTLLYSYRKGKKLLKYLVVLSWNGRCDVEVGSVISTTEMWSKINKHRHTHTYISILHKYLIYICNSTVNLYNTITLPSALACIHLLHKYSSWMEYGRPTVWPAIYLPTFLYL